MKNVIWFLVGVGAIVAAVADIRYKGLFYKALPTAFQQGLDEKMGRK